MSFSPISFTKFPFSFATILYLNVHSVRKYMKSGTILVRIIFLRKIKNSYLSPKELIYLYEPRAKAYVFQAKYTDTWCIILIFYFIYISQRSTDQAKHQPIEASRLRLSNSSQNILVPKTRSTSRAEIAAKRLETVASFINRPTSGISRAPRRDHPGEILVARPARCPSSPPKRTRKFHIINCANVLAWPARRSAFWESRWLSSKRHRI